MNSRLVAAITFSFAVAIGAAAAVTSQGAVSQHVAPGHNHAAPVEVIRIDPVVVTASRAWFEAVRAGKLDDTRLASDGLAKVSSGG